MKTSAPSARRLFTSMTAMTAVASLAALVACAAEHTQTPAPFDPGAPGGSAAPASSAPPATAASIAPAPATSDEGPRAQTAAQKRPLEITNQCEHPANYFVGDEPKATGPGKRTVEPMAILPVERRPDGSQTVWLLDEHFAPLVKVGITRGMKKIEIGRSCRTIDAR